MIALQKDAAYCFAMSAEKLILTTDFDPPGGAQVDDRKIIEVIVIGAENFGYAEIGGLDDIEVVDVPNGCKVRRAKRMASVAAISYASASVWLSTG